MSEQTKRTVIGVVVGIGGAALLAGVALVAWRVWGRRRHVTEEDDDLVGPHSMGPEKHSSGSNSNPFKSTLDQYHSAPQPVNTSSNF
jgi:hypothetical protein